MNPTRCWMLVSHAGDTAHYTVDLVLSLDRPPVAVLEWTDCPDGTCIPSVAVQLDPRWLTPFPGQDGVTHSYAHPIQSPIPMR